MPERATKRGAQRTRLERDCDVLVCGASFAGLAVARELAGTGARVLVIDRYEIGERQTSACGIPTAWLDAMDLGASLRQTFGEELALEAAVDVFDFRLSRAVRAAVGAGERGGDGVRDGDGEGSAGDDRGD